MCCGIYSSVYWPQRPHRSPSDKRRRLASTPTPPRKRGRAGRERPAAVRKTLHLSRISPAFGPTLIFQASSRRHLGLGRSSTSRAERETASATPTSLLAITPV